MSRQLKAMSSQQHHARASAVGFVVFSLLRRDGLRGLGRHAWLFAPSLPRDRRVKRSSRRGNALRHSCGHPHLPSEVIGGCTTRCGRAHRPPRHQKFGGSPAAASPVAAGATESGRRRHRRLRLRGQRVGELRCAVVRRGRRVYARWHGWGWCRRRRLQGVVAATTAAAAAARTCGGQLPRGRRGCRPPLQPPPELCVRWWRVWGWGAPSAVLPAR